ncbi:MAG TPA: polyprenyl synthetase family protein [Cyclobacteriaceae bacterium]|nr:polyprenyl synthetase family protein [Cyclobacteriaceae bacterium]
MELIEEAIGPELARFSQYYKDAFTSDTPLLDKILGYLAAQKGKQLRPMFGLLCARLGGAIGESSYRAALFVEILHTSSLLHDDLVDEALERRSAFSVNALWKNRTTVFTGDYLFTRAILLLLSHGDHRILKIFSEAIGKVIEGELLQLEKSRQLNLDEGLYYDIIKGKTATLLAACCAAGAASTFREEEPVRRLHQFGEKLGMAFQIRDDLLDYGTAAIGKPTGNDIKERKVTLPLLYTLNHCEKGLRRKLLHIVRHKNTDADSIAFLNKAVADGGGMAYATEKMLAFREEALQLLAGFESSPARSALEALARYSTERAI